MPHSSPPPRECLKEEKRKIYSYALLSTDVFKGQLARGYLGAIDEIIESNISGFDALRFRKDVEDLFEEQGWLAYA